MFNQSNSLNFNDTWRNGYLSENKSENKSLDDAGEISRDEKLNCINAAFVTEEVNKQLGKDGSQSLYEIYKACLEIPVPKTYQADISSLQQFRERYAFTTEMFKLALPNLICELDQKKYRCAWDVVVKCLEFILNGNNFRIYGCVNSKSKRRCNFKEMCVNTTCDRSHPPSRMIVLFILTLIYGPGIFKGDFSKIEQSINEDLQWPNYSFTKAEDDDVITCCLIKPKFGNFADQLRVSSSIPNMPKMPFVDDHNAFSGCLCKRVSSSINKYTNKFSNNGICTHPICSRRLSGDICDKFHPNGLDFISYIVTIYKQVPSWWVREELKKHKKQTPLQQLGFLI